jgi:hypothetical protein
MSDRPEAPFLWCMGVEMRPMPLISFKLQCIAHAFSRPLIELSGGGIFMAICHITGPVLIL